jgi:hypothetical protein
MPGLNYYCNICDSVHTQKSHYDAHKKSDIHFVQLKHREQVAKLLKIIEHLSLKKVI